MFGSVIPTQIRASLKRYPAKLKIPKAPVDSGKSPRWSGRRGSNPRHPAWKASALPVQGPRAGRGSSPRAPGRPCRLIRTDRCGGAKDLLVSAGYALARGCLTPPRETEARMVSCRVDAWGINVPPPTRARATSVRSGSAAYWPPLATPLSSRSRPSAASARNGCTTPA
jgi:hypothetical protein